jgi:hypothetical protein
MKYPLILILLFCSTALFSQSATYQLVNRSNVAYSNIAVRQTGDLLDVNILANWKSKDGTYGEFNGKGIINHNKSVIKADSASCKVSLSFSNDKLEVEFRDCMENKIPEEFSGTYTKIADHIRGEYIVTTAISYFYSKPDEQSRKKGFTNRSQIINIEELFAGDWGFATLVAHGKHSFGYVKLSDLKLKKTYLYD